jgi:hypothetical protein
MQLVLLGRDKWSVYAACEPDGTCPLLEFLAGIEDVEMADEILTDLREYVAETDQQLWFRTKFAKKLNGYDKILEFRWPKNSGPTPRVYFFFDAGRVVVCANGELKKGNNDKALIKDADDFRDRYLDAQKKGAFTVVDYDEFNDEAEAE